MWKQKNLTIFVLTLILVFGFFIRIYNLTSIPAGFFCDEAGITYFSYHIATTGYDPKGNFFPFFVNIFGPIGPVAVYDQLPIVMLMGANEFSARLSAVILGTATLLFIYFLTKLLTKSSFVGITATFLLTISPWHIQYSRFATENIRVPFYFALGILFFIIGIKKNRLLLLTFSLLSFFLTFYSYTGADLSVLFFICFTSLIYRKYFLEHKKKFLLLLVLLLVLITPFLQLFVSDKQNRLSEVSVFKNKTLIQGTTAMLSTYFLSYSPDFLFIKGDSQMPGHFITRFSVKGVGELYYITAPFLIIGFLYVLRHIKRKENQLILLWFLSYPFGSMIAGADGGGPFTTRSIIGVGIFQVIVAMGIVWIYRYLKRKSFRVIFLTLLICLLFFETGRYLYLYHVDYPKYSSDFWGWQFGPRDIMSYFLQQKDNYDELYIVGDFNAPYIFLKFYDPQNHCRNKCLIGDLTNFNVQKKQLFAITADKTGETMPYVFSVKKTIYYPNGSPAFYVGTLALRDK